VNVVTKTRKYLIYYVTHFRVNDTNSSKTCHATVMKISVCNIINKLHSGSQW
jgi:hypothetical protein